MGVSARVSACQRIRACAAAPLAYSGLRRRARALRAALQSHPAHRQADRMSSRIQQLDTELTSELGRVVVGAEGAIRALIIALIARGHVLVQGVQVWVRRCSRSRSRTSWVVNSNASR